MYLVLSAAGDTSAVWAYEGLKARRLSPIEIVTSEQLAYVRVWEHRVGEEQPRVRAELSDGRVFDSKEILGVINRLTRASLSLVQLGCESDREYAAQELSSFYVSWLRAVHTKMIGQPHPSGFCGRWRHISEWALLAQRAHLPTPTFRTSSVDVRLRNTFSFAPPGCHTKRLLIVRGKAFGHSLPNATIDACIRLADSADADLLGVSVFEGRDGEWNFADATPYPDLRLGDEAFLDHLQFLFGFC